MESIGDIIKRTMPITTQNSKPGTIEIKYTCPICRDGGWITPRGMDGKPLYDKTIRCECRAQADWEKKQAAYLKRCELPPATDDRTFETYKTGNNASLKEALEAAKDVINKKLVFLTLVSDVDHGKTHLAIAICRAWLGKGKSAKYAFVPLLLDELKAGFKQEGDHSYDSTFNFYQKVELLVLDDLGAEHKTAWSIEKLETIIDYRYINELPTVITTNCSPDEFTSRIRSRIQRAKNSRIVVISGPEYRLTKKK